MMLSTREASSERATVLRRVVFIVYAAGLASGTHWPRLQIGDPMHPPDKLLHFICFGGLAFFLYQARYFRRYWVLLLVGIAWTIVDELTQQLPGLGRSFSIEDIVASSFGVLVATSICWSLQPCGGAGARLRRERFDECMDAVLARPVAWLAIATSAAFGAAVGVPLAVVVDGFTEAPTPFQAAVVGGLLGGTALGGAMLLVGMRREEASRFANGRWIELPTLVWRDVIKACALPIAGGVAMLIALFVAGALLLILRRDVALASDLLRWLDSLSKGMPTMLDATATGLVVSVVVDRCRVRLARRLDEADRRCLACGQDLRATPAPSGTGRCGECGASFVRMDKICVS